MQAGPKLTEIAINDGMSPGHEHFAVVAARRRALPRLDRRLRLAAAGQVKVTGRLAA